MEEKNIISFGAGQNSTAMIIQMNNDRIKIDDIIYADTGNEESETYEFLIEFKQWCKDNNIKFTTVRSHLYPLRDYYFDRKLIPYRYFRSCTDKFKIRPINKYVKEEYPKYFINMYMGIASDEKHREKETSRKNQKMIYPLIEKNIDRKKCIEIIRNENMTIPVKSGCHFCPFQSKQSWLRQLEVHPKIFEDNIIFEENCKAFPDGIFFNIPLRKLKEIAKSQTKLDKWLQKKEIEMEQCVYCHT